MIKTKPWPGPLENDLTGRFFSDLLVIGYAGPKYNGDGSKWVVRCICGEYEIRRSQRLKRQRSDRIYRCQVCEDRIQKQRHQEYLGRILILFLYLVPNLVNRVIPVDITV